MRGGQIFNEDCLVGMQRIADESVDCIIADLPYGVTKFKWDCVIPFEPLWAQYKRIIKPHGAICLFGTEPFSSALRMSNPKMFRYDWIWEKSKASNFQHARRQPLKAHEIISIFSVNGIEQLVKIVEKGYRIDLNQGNSARLVTKDVAEVLGRIKWLGSQIRFAADTLAQLIEVDTAMYRIDRVREKLGKPLPQYLVYTIIRGDIDECNRRLSYYQSNPRVRIVAQPYRDLHDPLQVIPSWQKDMAHWANRRQIWKSCDFKDFTPRIGFRCNEYFLKRL